MAAKKKKLAVAVSLAYLAPIVDGSQHGTAPTAAACGHARGKDGEKCDAIGCAHGTAAIWQRPAVK